MPSPILKGSAPVSGEQGWLADTSLPGLSFPSPKSAELHRDGGGKDTSLVETDQREIFPPNQEEMPRPGERKEGLLGPTSSRDLSPAFQKHGRMYRAVGGNGHDISGRWGPCICSQGLCVTETAAKGSAGPCRLSNRPGFHQSLGAGGSHRKD